MRTAKRTAKDLTEIVDGYINGIKETDGLPIGISTQSRNQIVVDCVAFLNSISNIIIFNFASCGRSFYRTRRRLIAEPFCPNYQTGCQMKYEAMKFSKIENGGK